MSIITVGISDFAVSDVTDDILVTYALGSCVGICLRDQSSNIGGLAHIMLPNSKEHINSNENYKKYADTGIFLMMKEMLRIGAKKENLTAKIVGGAQMFAGINSFNIGERNVNSVKQILDSNKIRIVAEETGDKIGRTVFFEVSTGKLEVKSASKGIKII